MSLLCSQMIYARAPKSSRPATAAPTPIPAFAAVLRSEGVAAIGPSVEEEVENAVAEEPLIRLPAVVEICAELAVVTEVIIGELMEIVVDGSHVLVGPLVEAIVKFPPSTVLPSLAPFGNRLK
jgi:hypothetical protein